MFLGFRAGAGAGQSLTAENATAVGSFAYTTKSDQVALGSDSVIEIRAFGVSFMRARPAGYNYWVGQGALVNPAGTHNIAVGYQAGENLDTAEQNVAVGYLAVNALRGGDGNVAFGDVALAGSLDAVDCTAVGSRAMAEHQGGVGSTAIGKFTAHAIVGNGYNTLVGDSPLRYGTTASETTIVGYRAAEQTETGARNTFAGTGAWLNKPHGDENVAVGYSAAWANPGSPNKNVAIGAYALRSVTGDNSVAVGSRALFLADTACVGLGGMAGSALTAGTGCAFLGWEAGAGGAQASGIANATAVGAGANTTASNQVVLGADQTETTLIRGDVGVGLDLVAPIGVLQAASADEEDTLIAETATASPDDVALNVLAAVAGKTTAPVDGFGPSIGFEISEGSAAPTPLAQVGAVIAGGDTTGRIVLSTFLAGAPVDSAWVEGAAFHVAPTEPLTTGGSAQLGLTLGDAARFGFFAGDGIPLLEADRGSIYLRTDGSTTNDRAYLNIDGADGWVALVTDA